MLREVFKNLRNYKRITATLVLTFVICQLVTILIAVAYKNAYLSFIKENNGLNKTSIELRCKPSLINANYIVPSLKNISGDVHLRLLGNLSLKDYLGDPRVYLEFYSGEKNPVELPVISGENFNSRDFINNTKVVLIGKNLIKNLSDKENIVIDGIKYRVKGVLGRKKYKTELDNYLVIPLNTISEKSGNNLLVSGEFHVIINGSGNEIEVANQIENNIKKYDDMAKIDVFPLKKNKNILLYVFGDNEYFKVLLLMTYFLSIVACTYITNYWIKRMEKKISIRIAFGGSIKNTINYVLLNITLISVMATILSAIVILILNPILSKYNGFNLSLYLDNLIIMFLISMINSLIVVGINIFRIVKINPATNINKF